MTNALVEELSHLGSEEVGNALAISERTVKTHLTNIF